MDFPFKHWSPFPRFIPAPLQVSSTNFLNGKNYWIRRSVRWLSFCFIFRGKGSLHHGKEIIPVQSPCILNIFPDVHFEYGPDTPEDAWDELYFIYDRKFMKYSLDAHLIDRNQIIRPMHNSGLIWEHLEELSSLVHSRSPERQIDRIDRLCEKMIFEALSPPLIELSNTDIVSRIAQKIRSNPHQSLNVTEMARCHGMSLQTFRRKWDEVTGMSPRAFLEHIRIQRACCLLAESTQSVKNIAHSMGFEDEFYFSRRFQKAMGFSPRNYRIEHHL